MRVVLLRRPAGGEAGRDESLGSMKQKYAKRPPGAQSTLAASRVT